MSTDGWTVEAVGLFVGLGTVLCGWLVLFVRIVKAWRSGQQPPPVAWSSLPLLALAGMVAGAVAAALLIGQYGHVFYFTVVLVPVLLGIVALLLTAALKGASRYIQWLIASNRAT
jgi:hypothetical protein